MVNIKILYNFAEINYTTSEFTTSTTSKYQPLCTTIIAPHFCFPVSILVSLQTLLKLHIHCISKLLELNIVLGKYRLMVNMSCCQGNIGIE